MDDGGSAFECTGSPRIHPFYDSIKKFSKHQSDWSQDAWVLALCRFKGFSLRVQIFLIENFLNFFFENFVELNFFLDENDEWKLGNLIQFATSRKGPVSPWYKDKAEKPQCCPVDGIATSDSTR